MGNLESQVKQLRADIGKRVGEAARLRERSDTAIQEGASDRGIDLHAKALATENAVAVLRGKLTWLLPELVGERVKAAAPEIDRRLGERVDALAAEAKRALACFRDLFAAWNELARGGIGLDAASQLMADFDSRMHSIASDDIYAIAVERWRQIREGEATKAVEAERAALEARIRAEVAQLGVVDVTAVEKQEVVA